MKTFTYNSEVGDQAITAIRDHPEEWAQGHWMFAQRRRVGGLFGPLCGTSCCIAGRVTLQAGWQPLREGSFGQVGRKVDGNLQLAIVSELAKELLGLNAYRAYQLFSSNNSLSVLEGMLKHYANNPLSYSEAMPNEDLGQLALYRDTTEKDRKEYYRLVRESISL